MNTTTRLQIMQHRWARERSAPATPARCTRTRYGMLWFAAMLAGITLLGATLRLYHLGAASFWVDELKTIHACTHLADMHKSKLLGYVPTWLGLWASGVHPSRLPPDHPEAWHAMGLNEWSARIGSCLVGIVTIPILGLAGRRFVGARGSLIFALLLAVAPWHIYWSQASRFYTLQFLFYNLCLLWYFTATRDGSRGWLTLALVCGVLAFLAQPPGLVIVAIFAFDWLLGLLRREPVRLGWFGWMGALACLAICGLVLTWDVQRKPEEWTQFAGSLYQSPLKMILGSIYMIGPAVIFFSGVSACHRLKGRDRQTIYLILAAVLPVVVYAVVSTRTYVSLRYAFVCLFPCLVLAAMGAEEVYLRLRQHGKLLAAAPVGLLLVSMMLMNHGYYTSGAGFHERWREAFNYVAARRTASVMVYTNGELVGQYYLGDGTVQRLRKEPSEIQPAGRCAWIVLEAEDTVRGERIPEFLRETAELKALFDLDVVQPRSSVHVYRYVPPASRADQPHATSGDSGAVPCRGTAQPGSPAQDSPPVG